ncbi:protein phosphatase 2C-like domain-containing protein 1 [Lingula anatina]|uniref:Protein phosphatase 2C-like domain-containing protein 1 n=1 Tax=Lingula anatina TaxID=7574 RepID=A0A1S3J781_LINAN|nr:protein phosphatase 2C-like domain-containing protein 1 [Lingula anatina]|eukprot:XP_023931873.1 protein phosphatase 2C-like domain-containing protein 1 [Lingula anatina]
MEALQMQEMEEFSSDDDDDSQFYADRVLGTSEEEVRATTPETELSEYPEKPDITMMCDKCKIFVDLRDLKDHRAYHNSLETMRYFGDDYPEDLQALVQRRILLLRELRSEYDDGLPPDAKMVQTINSAFELLKSDLEDTYTASRQMEEKMEITSEGLGLNCRPKCVLAMGMCSDRNERWKNSMEDCRVFQDSFGEDDNKSYFAIYDGHGGAYAAEMAASELQYYLLKEMQNFDPNVQFDHIFTMDELDEKGSSNGHSYRGKSGGLSGRKSRGHSEAKKKKDPYSENMSSAFIEAYYQTDHYLSFGKDEQSRVRWSGCSALTVLLQNTCPEEYVLPDTRDQPEVSKPEPPKQLGLLHLAHAGNVQAILVRDNRAYRLTRNHTPTNDKERARVIKEGGYISESDKNKLVNGILLATRGLGNHGDVKLKKCVPCEPFTTTVPIDQYAQFLILASHGIWEVFSENEAAALLVQLLPSNQIPAPSVVSTSVNLLLAEYNARGQSNMEDIDASIYTPMSKAYDQRNKSQQSNMRKLSFNDEINIDSVSVTSKKSAGKTNVMNKQAQSPILEQHEENNKPLAENHLKPNYDPDDMRTEIGSNTGYESGHESGEEGDVESMTDLLSMPGQSGRSSFALTREDIQRDFAKVMSERLVHAALLAGAKDNITAMVILFPGCGL